jgi:hypothetical protein
MSNTPEKNVPIVPQETVPIAPKVETSAEIEELKHSIRIHLLIMAGPSQQLCAYLIKVIDLVEDTDIPRRKTETLQLAFSIVEAVAIHTQQAIDARNQVSKQKNNPMPEAVYRYADELLVVVGQARSHPDKIEAKNSVLAVVGKALDALGTFTGSTYPTVFDSAGNRLNNHEKKQSDAAGPVTIDGDPS